MMMVKFLFIQLKNENFFIKNFLPSLRAEINSIFNLCIVRFLKIIICILYFAACRLWCGDQHQ